MTKYLYCEKCEDLVPESEVKKHSEVFPNFDLDAFPEFALKRDKVFHYYSETINIYGNHPGVIGCCLEERKVFCGDVREAAPEEYFILFTCNPKRNK